MKIRPTRSVLAAVCSLFLLAVEARILEAADPFYLEQLRDGNYAYDRGDFATAARTLRLACFGMLDEPKALGACLARLALAQERAGDLEGFRATFVRLAEAEDRFQAYSQAELPPEVRAALEQRVAARIPAATLESSPAAFRSLAARKPGAGKPAAPAQAKTQPKSEPKTAPKAPPKDTPPPTAAAPAKPVAAPPSSAAEKKAPADRAGGQAIQRPTQAGATAPSLSAPPAPRPLSDEEKGKLESVRKLLAENAKAKELQRGFQLAQEVAAAHPESADAQRLAGETAYRVSRWSDAVSYLQRGGGPPDSEPELLFYLAVSLFESGDSPGAAAALRRSLPNLQRSPYVDAYARKILGQ